MNRKVTVIDRPVVAPTETPTDKPGGATVILLNDPVTPFQVVQEALMYGAALSSSEAAAVMMKTHNKGWFPVATYASADLATTVAEKIMTHARNNKGHEGYRRILNHTGPWPLTADVMDAGK